MTDCPRCPQPQKGTADELEYLFEHGQCPAGGCVLLEDYLKRIKVHCDQVEIVRGD